MKLTRKSAQKPQENDLKDAVVTNRPIATLKTKNSKVGVTPPEDPLEDEGDTFEGKVRLSCDLSRSYHRALRVAAAHCEGTIVEMVETLIDKHLMNATVHSITSIYQIKKAGRLKGSLLKTNQQTL